MLYVKRNLPLIERGLRLALGACVAYLTLRFAPGTASAVIGYAIAATLASTAAVGFCPACALVGRKPVV